MVIITNNEDKTFQKPRVKSHLLWVGQKADWNTQEILCWVWSTKVGLHWHGWHLFWLLCPASRRPSWPHPRQNAALRGSVSPSGGPASSAAEGAGARCLRSHHFHSEKSCHLKRGHKVLCKVYVFWKLKIKVLPAKSTTVYSCAVFSTHKLRLSVCHTSGNKVILSLALNGCWFASWQLMNETFKASWKPNCEKLKSFHLISHLKIFSSHLNSPWWSWFIIR